jgi:Putative adhesin
MTTTGNSIGQNQAKTKPRRTRALLIIGAAAVVVGVGAAAAVMINRTQQITTDSFAGVSSVVVEIDNGSIAMSPAGDDKVGVRTTLNGFSGGLPVAGNHLENGLLTITSACPPNSMNCYVEDELTIPAGLPVKVRTTTGTVDATDLDVSEFDIQTRTGAVTGSFARPPDRVAIAVATGSVELTMPAGSYRFDASTTTGSVRTDVQNDPAAQRTLQLSTGTGDITVTAR